MKAFIGILLTMLGCLSCVASAKHQITLSGIGPSYERGQPSEITLTNVGKGALRVYSSLEVLDESGAWVAWPFRVEDGKAGAISTIYLLSSGSSIKISFDVRKIALPPVPSGQKPKMANQLEFRFKVVALQEKSDTRVDELVSESFVVMHPYGK